MTAKPALAMTPKRARVVIDSAFNTLKHEVESKSEPSRLFERAYEGALAGEKHHRTHAWVPEGPYRNSIKTAARYFVVNWYFNPAKIADALEAVSIREDCLYASALRLSLGKSEAVFAHSLEFGDIDYAEHIAAPAIEP